MKHPLDGKSFSVHVLDPEDESLKHELFFYYNRDKVKGGEEEEFDFDNIDELKLKITEDKVDQVTLHKKNYFNQVSIYPEDSIWSLKQKIYLCTGIPIYRQHLFIKQGDIHKTGYNIVIQDSEYPINRLKDTKKVMNIKIDLTMYSNREFLQVRTEETYTTIDDIIHEQFYLYDLNDYFANVNKSELLGDNYQYHVIYFSVIKKYFPVLDDAMFKQYLMDENKVISMYPLLNIPKSYLENRYSEENKILIDVYSNNELYNKKYGPHILTEICDIEIVCENVGGTLSIRNLIDTIQTDRTYIAVDSYISNNGQKYRVIKHWLGLENYILQQVIDADEDYFSRDFVVVYIFDGVETHNLYIYDDGSYKLVGRYAHTHDVNLDNVMDKTAVYVQPIIDVVNKNTKYLFTKLHKYTMQNVDFQKIHIKLKWDAQYNEMQFNQFLSVFDRYFTSGVLERRTVTPRPSTYMTKIVKGMYKNNVRLYLKKGAETRDYYIIFKDQKIHETWNNRYSGENMEITNTLINIIFELHGMTIKKYQRAYAYILQLINEIATKVKKEDKIRIVNKSGKKKKFKDIDPELYDFEDEKGIKYSRICQKKHRPIDILTENQYKELSEKDKKYIFPFINYTTGEPVYYKCSDKLPYAGFIVNKHPKGYCVPKCKSSDTNGVKNRQIWELCTSKRIVEKGQLETKTHNDNILKFGKVIEEGKYGHMHDSVLSILDVDRDEFLLVGYPQYFTEVNGGYILDILAFQLGVNPVNIVDKIIEELTADMWNSILSANVKFEEFVMLLHKFRQNESDNQISWSDVFIEISGFVFNLYFIIFDTIVTQSAELLNQNNSSINIKYTDYCKFSIKSNNPIRMCIITSLYDTYYPMNLINYDGTIKIFDEKTKVNKKICKLIKKLETIVISQYASFEYVNIKKHYTVKTKYVWQKNVNYVELTNGALIGCYNSINFTDGVEEVHQMVDIKNTNSTFENVIAVISDLSKEVPNFICHNNNLDRVNACTDCDFIGCRVGNIFSWFKPVTCDHIKQTYPKFDIELANYDIADVNLAIITGAEPANKHLEGINQTYYNAYIYKLFKYEFYKVLLLYKKSQHKFVKKYKNNELAGFIQSKKSEYTYSYNKVVQILKYSENVEKDLRNMIVYEDIFKLRELIMTFTFTEMKRVARKYVVEVNEVKDIPIQNVIYSPLEFSKLVIEPFDFETSSTSEEESLFYKNGRLKVKGLDDLVRLLMQDINNELLFIYEITDFQLMFIINYLNFRNFDDEKIIIQSL